MKSIQLYFSGVSGCFWQILIVGGVAAMILGTPYYFFWLDCIHDAPCDHRPWVWIGDRVSIGNDDEADVLSPPPSPEPGFELDRILGLYLNHEDVVEQLAKLGDRCLYDYRGGLNFCLFSSRGVGVGYDSRGILVSLLLAGPRYPGMDPYQGPFPFDLESLTVPRERVRRRIGRQPESFGNTDCYDESVDHLNHPMCFDYHLNGRRGSDDDEIVGLWFRLSRNNLLYPENTPADHPSWVRVDADSLPVYRLDDLPVR